MPYSIKGCVVMDENGDYNIYINSKLPKREQLKAYIHEFDHVFYDDFSCSTAKEAETRKVDNYGKAKKTPLW